MDEVAESTELDKRLESDWESGEGDELVASEKSMHSGLLPLDLPSSEDEDALSELGLWHLR